MNPLDDKIAIAERILQRAEDRVGRARNLLSRMEGANYVQLAVLTRSGLEIFEMALRRRRTILCKLRAASG